MSVISAAPTGAIMARALTSNTASEWHDHRWMSCASPVATTAISRPPIRLLPNAYDDSGISPLRRLSVRLRQTLDSARGLGRSGFHRALIPGACCASIRAQTEDAKFSENNGIVGGAEQERGFGMSGISGRPPHQPRRRKIPVFEEFHASRHQVGNSLRAELDDGRARQHGLALLRLRRAN